MIALPNRGRCLGLGVGLLAAWFFIADAQARLPFRRPGGNRTNGIPMAAKGSKGKGGANAQAVRQLVGELHSARLLLQQAKHDYDGHRVKAIHEINQAIQAIHQHHGTGKGTGTKAGGLGQKGTGGGQGTGVVNGGASKETQQQSDALLRQARQQLHTIHGQMQATHHPKAKGLVHAAVLHLDTALKIR